MFIVFAIQSQSEKFLACLSKLEFEIIKIKFTDLHETRTGLALLVWRDVVFTM